MSKIKIWFEMALALTSAAAFAVGIILMTLAAEGGL
jgi:hypothetical protein